MDFGKRLILGWGLHQKDKNVLKTSSNTFNIDGFCNQTLLIGKHGGIKHLLMDAGIAESLESGRMMAAATIAVSVVFILAAFVWVVL